MGLSMRRRRKGQLAVAIAHSVLNLVLFLGGALLVAVSVYSMQLLGTGPGAVPAARPLPSTQPTAPAPPTAPHRRAPHATEPPARPMHLSLVVGVASIVIVALSVPSHFGRPKKPCVCLYQVASYPILTYCPLPTACVWHLGLPKKPYACVSCCVHQALLLLATATVAALLAATFVTQQAVSDASSASGGGFALASLGAQQQERWLGLGLGVGLGVGQG